MFSQTESEKCSQKQIAENVLKLGKSKAYSKPSLQTVFKKESSNVLRNRHFKLIFKRNGQTIFRNVNFKLLAQTERLKHFSQKPTLPTVLTNRNLKASSTTDSLTVVKHANPKLAKKHTF